MPNRSRAPLDGWDPYGDREPRRRNRWAFRRLARLSIPIAVGLFAFGHDILRLLDSDHRNQTDVAVSQDAPSAPPLGLVVAPPPDPRKILPRTAKPVAAPATWFTSEDYPASALRQNLVGVVHFRFIIDPDGRVQHCVPITTSGSQLLDTTACGVFMLNARYWPARDNLGHPIAQVQTETVKWQIPKE